MGRKGKENTEKDSTPKNESSIALNPVEHEDTTRYSKRQMKSNWQKYDDPIGTDTCQGLDFAKFADQKPALGDSHFRFTSEKNWELKDKVSDYFLLNVKNLQDEILCIPLHKRLDIDSKLLDPQQIAAYEREAAAHHNRIKENKPLTEEVNQRFLNAIKDNEEKSIANTQWDRSEEKSNPTGTWDPSSENFFNLDDMDTELDQLLSMSSPLKSSNVPSELEEDKENEVTEVNLSLNEDWLDTLLNDD